MSVQTVFSIIFGKGSPVNGVKKRLLNLSNDARIKKIFPRGSNRHIKGICSNIDIMVWRAPGIALSDETRGRLVWLSFESFFLIMKARISKNEFLCGMAGWFWY